MYKMTEKICPSCKVLKAIEEYKYGRTKCYSCFKQQSREWKAKNKDKVAAYNKEYKAENREEISKYNSKYNIENRAAIQKRSTANTARLKQENPSFKMACTLRARIYQALKADKATKVDHTLTLLGCPIDFFRKWLEYCFEDDMSFENHGEVWHVDHTVPCAKFNLTIESEQRKCFHWSNMKPMYARENISKNCNATEKELKKHEDKLVEFLKKIKEFRWTFKYTLIDIDRKSYIK